MPPCHHLLIASRPSPYIAHSPLTTPASFLFLRLTRHTPVSGPSLQLCPVPETLFPQVPPLSLTFRSLLLKVVLRTLVNSVISSPITWGDLPSLTGSTFLSHINYLISGRARTAQWQILGSCCHTWGEGKPMGALMGAWAGSRDHTGCADLGQHGRCCKEESNLFLHNLVAVVF